MPHLGELNFADPEHWMIVLVKLIDYCAQHKNQSTKNQHDKKPHFGKKNFADIRLEKICISNFFGYKNEKFCRKFFFAGD